MPWTKLTTTAELPPGSLMEIEHEGALFALCNVNGEVRALSGTCPHQGGPLGEGSLNGEVVACPWHMWEFHSATGECSFNGLIKIPVYATRIEGEDVLVDIA